MKEKFSADLTFEYCKAEQKHPSWPDDAIHASAILNEEAGKLTQACIDYNYNHIPREEAVRRMLEYAARVGAMAMRFSEGVRRAEYGCDEN